MKKIWSLLLLLLLLILCCLWTKTESIHLTTATEVAHTAHTASHMNTNAHEEEIEFKIVEKNKAFTLNGNFKDTQQQDDLVDLFAKSTKTLQINHTSTNKERGGGEALALIHSVIPHFLSHYKNSMLQYQNGKLTIDGDIDSYEAQHEMQRLLVQSTIPSLDNGNVVPPPPMTLNISKTAGRMYATGTVGNAKQLATLKNNLPKSAYTKDLKVAHVHSDTEALKSIDILLPMFIKDFHKGGIRYKNETLTIYGATLKNEALKEVDSLIKNHHLSVKNHTKLDIKAIEAAKKAAEKLAAAEAEKKAKKAAARKAKEEAEALAKAQETERLAAIEAEKKAKEEAARKAKEEAEALAKAQETERLTAIKAENKAEKLAAQEAQENSQKRKNELKTKLKTLLEHNTIEFNVNKSTLSDRGNTTVAKLASILTQYPSIKIEIAGHTDSDGSAEYNQKLSQARVDQVKKSLIAKNISASRLRAVGYGETKPLVKNNSDENKAKNRRVEINIQGE